MFAESARYYDAIYASRGKDYEKEAQILRDLISSRQSAQGETLLDVACGTGGHMMYLKDAFEVQGVDLDGAMLQIAHEKLPGIPLHEADMASFSLPMEFDIVVNLFSSIGYAGTPERLAMAVANMANHTKPEGLVIVEPWIYPEDFTPGKAHAVFVDQPDLKISRMDVSKVDGRLSILDFHYLVAEHGEIRHFQERHEIGLFTHEEYRSAFEAAGLEAEHDPEGVDGRGLYIGVKL